MKNVPATGVYASAEALAQSPDYARKLVEEHGIDLFVIRTGFDPRRLPPHLDAAVSSVTRLGAKFQFLVGAWWGEDRSGFGETMTAAAHWLDYDRSLAHEAQWPMQAPGGESDGSIRDAIYTLCADYHPAGICLTHARFKHAADINSLFGVAGGPFGEAMNVAGFTPRNLGSMLFTVDQRLWCVSPERISGTTLIGFLDSLTESDFFSRWFDFRCRQVTAAVEGIFAPVRHRYPDVKLGTNAVGPLFSRLSGQDYHQLADCCDFVQPLLGYMHWHVLQPIHSWATLLRQKSGTLDSRAALLLSARLFGLNLADCALDWDRRKAPEDGDESAVISVVQRQLDALDGLARTKVAPVLCGQGVSTSTIETLIRSALGHGFHTVLFQGADDAPWQIPTTPMGQA